MSQTQVDTKETEKEFIKSTIEELTTLQSNLDELELLLEDMHVTEPGWELDANILIDKIYTNAGALENNYIKFDINLTADQKEKYAGTIAEIENVYSAISSMYNDLIAANETYDQKLYESVYGKIIPAKGGIKTALDKINEDRYK